MDEMTKEELLSAYLDGEVTAEQRAYVEKLIETDAEARGALEELRALSDSLKALPRMEVGEDLSERVLRRAERAILQQKPDEKVVAAAASAALAEPTEKTSTAETVAQKSDDTLVQSRSSTGAGSGIGWGRRLAGPLAAIAAALLIMVMSQNKEEADLAQAPHGGVASAPEDSEESAEIAHRDEAFEAEPNHAFKASEEVESTNGTARYRTPGEPGAPSMSAMRSPGNNAKKEFYADHNANSAEDADVDGVADKLAKSEFSRSKLNDLRTKSPDRVARQPDDVSESGLGRAGERNRASTAQVPLDGTGTDMLKEGSRRGAYGIAGKKGAGPTGGENDDLGTEPQLVVDLVVSSAALESGAFDQLLARQNIYFESPNDDLDRLADESAAMRKNQLPDEQQLVEDAPAAPSAELAQSKTGENLKTEKADLDERSDQAKDPLAGGAKKSLQRIEKPSEDDSGAYADESVELVYVVASASQVQAALQEMQQQSQNYLAYSIEPQRVAPDGYASGAADKKRRESQSEAEQSDLSFGQQSAVAEAKESNQPLAEKSPKQAQSSKTGNLGNSARPPEIAGAETPQPAKPSAKPAPAPPHDRALQVRGKSRHAEVEADALQSGAFTNRGTQQLPAGRAQRVQIQADELSHWRENRGWYFAEGDDLLPSQELAANEMAKQKRQEYYQQGQEGGGRKPAGEKSPSVSTDPEEEKPNSGKAPAESTTPTEERTEKSKERESKKKLAAAAQPTAAEEPAPSTTLPPGRDTTNVLTQKQTAEQGEKSALALKDARQQFWQAGDMPAGVQEDDLVRVLFVVRGARINGPNVSQGQAGAAAETEASEAEQSAPQQASPGNNNNAPREVEPAPNPSPADEE